jgi:carbon-monoxide dehydrogenase large subunit
VTRLTGSSVRRVEDRRLLTGRGRFVDDLHLPGMLHAAFVRSPWPHARLAHVDTDAARALPGVIAVLTGAEMMPLLTHAMVGAAVPGLTLSPHWPLAVDEVKFVGDPVALVVAESRALAEDACDLVVLDGEPLALDDHVVFDDTRAYGDVDGAFARADRVVRATFVQQRQTNLPMEGRAGIADFDPATGELTYHAAHQNPHVIRMALADLLGVPAHRVRVLCDDVGGSFGQKAYVDREEVAVATASRQLGRPVKWIEDRVENLLAAGQAREETIDVEAAISDDGMLLGARIHMTLDQGAYQLSTLPPTIYGTIVRTLFPGPYRLRDYSFRSTVVASNKAMYLAFRGPWAAETFVRERLLDLVAREVGIDAVEVRRRNLRTEEELKEGTASGLSLHAVTARTTFERCVERIGTVEPRPFRGLGIAVVMEPAPGPPEYGGKLGAGSSPRTAQRAVAKLEPDGTVTVFTSQAPHGQSHQTTLAQLAADELSVPFERVNVVHGDTRVTPFNGVGTGGSRAATLASGAVIGVASTLRDRIREIAAELLEASADDLELVDGECRVKGSPSRGVDLGTVARATPGLDATFDYAIPEGGWSQATHACEVDVDPETGSVRIIRYVVVGDCGRLINPAVVEGQIRGGIAQGIGGVLHEWAAYADDGQPLATTLMDYLVPTAADFPNIEIEHLESPPQGPIDFRGVGEGGTIGAGPALVNAIADALAPLGVVVTERYLPPSRIVELLRATP